MFEENFQKINCFQLITENRAWIVQKALKNRTSKKLQRKWHRISEKIHKKSHLICKDNFIQIKSFR